MKELKNIDMNDKEIIELYTKPKPVTKEMIDRFLNSENTGSVSDTITESGDLHVVGESHASRVDGEEVVDEVSVGGTLEKITDDENLCLDLSHDLEFQNDKNMQWYCCGCGKPSRRK